MTPRRECTSNIDSFYIVSLYIILLIAIAPFSVVAFRLSARTAMLHLHQFSFLHQAVTLTDTRNAHHLSFSWILVRFVVDISLCRTKVIGCPSF